MTKALNKVQIGKLLRSHKGWKRDGDAIARSFRFEDFYETMAFVNAVAFIANQEAHHPDMMVGYNTLTIRYSTHSAGGLTGKDFACAKKINALG